MHNLVLSKLRFRYFDGIQGVSCILLGALVWAPNLAWAVEPQPPDVFDLVVISPDKTDSKVNVEAVIKQKIDATVELSMDGGGAAGIQAARRQKSYRLQRGKAEIREKMEVDVTDGKPHTIKATLRLLTAEGKPWMVIQREVNVGQSVITAVAADDVRVPVVQTLPDGTRIVERISRKEMRERGLPAPDLPLPEAGERPSADQQPVK